MAAQPGLAAVSELFHGVPGGCSHAGPPDQERAARTAKDGGQLSQVELGFITHALLSRLVFTKLLLSYLCVHVTREF